MSNHEHDRDPKGAASAPAGTLVGAPAAAASPKDEPTAIAPAPAALADPDADLPVVARLIVEIRSDGSRTVARGAIEDTTLGQRVAVEARGTSPLTLALQLARSIASVPRLSARAAVRGLLDRRRNK